MINLIIWLKLIVKKALFLDYEKGQTYLIKELRNLKAHVDYTYEKVNPAKSYYLIINFGYKHIIGKKVLKDVHRREPLKWDLIS